MTYYYKTLGQFNPGQKLYKSDVILITPSGDPLPSIDPETGDEIYYCSQCHEDMGNEWFLGPVCGKCCRKNHRRATR